MQEIADREERPAGDSVILKALFNTIPVIFPKEENRDWTGLTDKGRRIQDDKEI